MPRQALDGYIDRLIACDERRSEFKAGWFTGPANSLSATWVVAQLAAAMPRLPDLWIERAAAVVAPAAAPEPD